MTYQELQNAIANMLSRANMNAQGVMIPLFILMAEGRLNKKLRVEDGTELQLIPTAVGVGTYDLPTQTTGIRSVWVSGGKLTCTLDPMTPDQMTVLFPTEPGGYPSHYLRLGRKLYVRKVPNSANWTINVQIHAALPALNQEANTNGNWLSQKYPDVYIWQAMAIAAHHIKDYDARDGYQAQADAAIQELHDADAGDLWSGGTHAMRAM